MRRAPRWALLVIAVIAAVGVITPLAGFARADTPATAFAHARSENGLVRKINAERRAHGLAALKVDLQLTRVARGWSRQMSVADRLSHNPDLGTQVRGDWTRLGENVGYTAKTGATLSELVSRLHAAFMKSPSHRANVLGRFTRVGIGVDVARDGTMWATVNFARSSGWSNVTVNRAAAQSRRAFAAPSATGTHARFVIVAPSDSSRSAIDALRSRSGPLLLTHRGNSVDPNPVLHPVSRAEIDRVLRHAGTVYLAGNAVSDRTARELVADGYRINRISLTTAAALG